ncbi:hypothetical protein C8F01DRAFT_1245504 [Mycena amicta]|nr:hypothetical protein C8F01DRAFT_1245504 [Mycena amicta]
MTSPQLNMNSSDRKSENHFAEHYDNTVGADFGGTQTPEQFTGTSGGTLGRTRMNSLGSARTADHDRFGWTDDPSDFNTGAGDFNIGRTEMPASMTHKIRGNAEKLAGKMTGKRALENRGQERKSGL